MAKPERKYTLTAIGVRVEIGGITAGTGSKQKPAVLVNEVSVTYRANDLSEASVNLGYSTTAGLKKLQALFPREGEGAYLAELKIFALAEGKLTYLDKTDQPLFSGLVVGFSHRKAGSQIDFVVNAYGGPYPLTQIPVGSPGIHPASGQSLGVATLIGGSTLAGGGGGAFAAAAALINDLGGERNVVDAYKAVVKRVISTWDAAASSATTHPALYAALKGKFGLPATKAVVQAEVDKIQAVGNLNGIVFQEAGSSEILDITKTIWASASLSFWTYAINVFDKYGVELLCIGDKCFAMPFHPLADNPPNNEVLAEDLAVVEVKDFPFDSPTRVVVSGSIPQTLKQGNARIKFPNVGAYPKSEDDVTPQEKKTGIKTIFVEAPAFLAASVKKAAQPSSDLATQLQLMAGVFPGLALLAAAATLKAKQEAEVAKEINPYDDYARYVLMKQKFRQRTGMCVTKYNPKIIPGFTAKVIDPLDAEGNPIATVFGYLNEVTHVLSNTAPAAQTSFTLSYVRYDGEVDDNLRENPLYPGYDVKGAAATVLSEGLGL